MEREIVVSTSNVALAVAAVIAERNDISLAVRGTMARVLPFGSAPYVH